MLTIILPATDVVEEFTLQLEHSLVSLSKWESYWEKPFFGSEAKTEDETKDYVLKMIQNKSYPSNVMQRLTNETILAVNDYINSKQTATWFNERQDKRANSEAVTAELIYYWMISFKIPFSCETWHLNRLMTLIKICGIKQTKPTKMSRQEQAMTYQQLNEQRKQELGTTG